LLVSPVSDLLPSEDSPPPRNPWLDPMVEFSLMTKSEKGNDPSVILTTHCYRITRAFLIEEVKLMKRMLQQKDKSSKKSKKSKGKGKGKK
jgi:hypothetical protein